MASKSRRPNGHFWVFVKGVGAKRYTLRLGDITETQAERIKGHLTHLEKARRLGVQPDIETRAWLKDLSAELRTKVEKTGLIAQTKRRRIVRRLDRFLKRFLKGYDGKDGTVTQLELVRDNLIEYFGAGKHIRSITAGDADEFKRWLIKHGRKKSELPLARTTASRRMGVVKQAFDFAKRKRWIKRNPFVHIRGRIDVNPAKEVYVTERLIDKILDLATDPELRLIIALSRFAGLRWSSDMIQLTVQSIDSEHQTVKVYSPKTERYEHGMLRLTPLSDKVMQYVAELLDYLPNGATYLFPRRRELSATSTTNALEDLCRSIGVALWVRPWNNMRASCETDWQQQGYSIFETAAWMGHSPDVALRHYNRIANELTAVADLPSALRVALRPSEESRSEVKREAPPVAAATIRGDFRRRNGDKSRRQSPFR